MSGARSADLQPWCMHGFVIRPHTLFILRAGHTVFGDAPANDLAVVRPAAVRQRLTLGIACHGNASSHSNVSPQGKTLPPHAPVEANVRHYVAHPHSPCGCCVACRRARLYTRGAPSMCRGIYQVYRKPRISFCIAPPFRKFTLLNRKIPSLIL